MIAALLEDAAVIVLGPSGLETARRLKALLPGARLHGFEGRVGDADETFAETLPHLRLLFSEGRPIVGVCAAGILIRAVAPLLAAKDAEPPVIAVAEDGSVAVPLLGGHRGANAIARAIAAGLGATAAVTTAGDLSLGLVLDEPPPGWKIADPDRVKPIAADLLAGRPVSLAVNSGSAGWLDPIRPLLREGAPSRIVVDDRRAAAEGALLYHPPTLALGVGCERGAAPAEVLELAIETLQGTGLASPSVACVVSLDLKMDEPAIEAVAAHFGVPARFFSAEELEREMDRLANPSAAVFRAVGCHGVAEAAALAAVGRDGSLAVPKAKSRHATCAVARARDDIVPNRVGRARGRLAVVGIGPGAAHWRTPEASRALADADDVVGYSLYLDLLGGILDGKRRHDSKLTEEEVRVRKALDLAAEGRAVALVSSGDAGIYALAALVFELLDRENRPAWNRIAVSVVPGVSALQAAAARVGAPLGHDFCAVSLSDLLTPWADIERRLRAAAEGDFVVALYNPVSARRRGHLAAARDILLGGRGADTPVILARNLGRAGESVEVIRLADLEPARADMLTLVLIGSSSSRAVERGNNRWVYTPRGYSRKHS